ncbi:MAG: tetratricopeptide repeat protein [Polyangiales bacterium]
MAAPDAAIESLTTLLAQAPDHTEARTALIDLYLQTAQPDHAAAWLERWQSEANDWSTERDIRLRWAQVMEQRGDRQQAESMLTALQRESPTHLPLIEALAAFYRRQHASVALSALVDRASEDLRQAVVRGPADAALWQGQIRFLAAEGRAERAQVMAAAATALGIDLPTQAALCGPEGTLPGARQRALDAVLDPQLFPPSVSPALRQLLRLTTRAFERAIPFDLKALQATLVRGAGDLLADELQTLRQWLPEQDIEVWSTSVLPDACLPLAARPLRLLLGTSLRQHPEPAVRLFALLRGAACARAGLAVALYSAEDDLAHTVASLIHHHCPTFVPAGMQPGSLAPLGKKLRRWLERRDRAEVAEAAAACAADPNFQVQHIGVGVRDYANRVALLATGNLAAGLHTLLHIARVPVPNALPGRVDAMRQSPEAWSLFNFACSDAYIEARRHAAPPPPPSVATVTEGR